MKKNSIFPIILIALGGLVILIPWFLFPACNEMMELVSGNSTPMKCHWTAVMTTWLGILAVADGIICIFAKTSYEKIFLEIMYCLLGVVIVLTPTVLIGVCGNPAMYCHMAMRPALVINGCAIIVTGVIGVVFCLAEVEREKVEKEL